MSECSNIEKSYVKNLFKYKTIIIDKTGNRMTAYTMNKKNLVLLFDVKKLCIWKI
jgi:hypothetical protein